VEFVDYGNVEDCEIEHVTDHVRLGHIPIQCTKCIISGLRPVTGFSLAVIIYCIISYSFTIIFSKSPICTTGIPEW